MAEALQINPGMKPFLIQIFELIINLSCSISARLTVTDG